MSEGGTIWDAPNQQVVRADSSAPWDEGDGGSAEVAPVAADEPADAGADDVSDDDLDAMTKDELLAYAQQLGVSPANASMTKDELRSGIDAHRDQA